jgi:hypothetical protein
MGFILSVVHTLVWRGSLQFYPIVNIHNQHYSEDTGKFCGYDARPAAPVQLCVFVSNVYSQTGG